MKKDPVVINLDSIWEKFSDDNLNRAFEQDPKHSQCHVNIIEATVCAETGAKIVTYAGLMPRCLLAEKNTHRIESKNTASSRAIPVKKYLANVLKNPFVPLFWGANKSGMQSAAELPWFKRIMANMVWAMHRYVSVASVFMLDKLGLHKQWANRLVEPHAYVLQLCTATSFDNFLTLRLHGDAQPEMAYLAYALKHALEHTQFRVVSNNAAGLAYAENWHLPYVLPEERLEHFDNPELLAKISSARCCRVSYWTVEGTEPRLDQDLALFNRLVGSEPLHASPLEHPAYPAPTVGLKSRNFTDFVQYRELFERDNHVH